ncbi:MAG: POTRA domain-containing protein [Bacteroidota bacterium]
MKLTSVKISFIAISFLFLFLENTEAIPDSLLVQEQTLRVDSISISGNDITEDFIILRELTFSTGDFVNTAVLQYNKERVFSLRLFTKVEIYPEIISNKNIIRIELKESWYIYPIPFIRRQNGSMKKLSYGINFSFKNFRGKNEHLRTILSLGYDPFFALVYQNPALDYKRNLGLGLGLSFLKLSNKSTAAKNLFGNDFDYKFYSTEVILFKRLDLFNEFYSGIGFNYVEGPEKPIQRITASGKRIDRVVSFTLGYTYDSRDLKQFSQYGIFASAMLRHKGFGISNISYNIFQFDFREYRTIIKDFSARWRFALRHTFGSTIPLYDYSFLGYNEYVRGYSNDVSEGNNFLLASFEVSYPIVKEWDLSIKLPLIPQQLTSARIGIYLSAFTDAGQVFNNHQRFRFSDFNTGGGFGLTLLLLPYNAIRFEYAFNKSGKGEILIGTGFSF